MTTTRPFPCPDLQHTRLRPDHVLGAAAHLIGFQPTDSLLCVFIDDDHHVAVTARLDWDVCRADPEACAMAIAARGHNAGGSFAFLASIDPVVVDPGVLQRMRDQLEDLYFEVIWAGQLHGDVWRGLYCDDAGCPEHRIDRAAPSPILATLVSHGNAPAPDRDTVVAELAPAETGRATWVDLAGVLPGGDLETWRDATVARVMDLLADTPQLAPSDVALLSGACSDVRVRDVLLWRLTVAPEHISIGWHRAWQVFAETLRRCPTSHVAPVGAVAGLVAWQMGDGTRAMECLDRARDADPGHSLAGLVRQCVDAGITPLVWQAVMGSMDEQTCRHGETEAHEVLTGPQQKAG